MTRRLRTRRRGVTLIELLIVATIMLTLAAASVPTIKPMLERRLTSSGASVVSTYLNRARARAMATNRPCGVTFELYPGTDVLDVEYDSVNDVTVEVPAGASLVLRQVEVPPYYSGLDESAVATVPGTYYVDDGAGGHWENLDCRVLRIDDAAGLHVDAETGTRYNVVAQRFIDGRLFILQNADPAMIGRTVRPISGTNDVYWDKFVMDEASTSIQFDQVGPYFPLVHGVNHDEYFIVEIPGVVLPERYQFAYKISRDPRATMTAPVGLGQGAVIDLEYCGTDERRFVPSNITIMFSPSGEVDYVVDASGKFVPSDTIYFLVGRWERLAALG
ncbi:MAG: prepilin-type N-terminal cleavage/methylation domain-containing protein, partial [Thermoguttaceae bacterium]|nr:prepilin-type N-terminal cleavage/methylation domain-containing protein [Thermoguttaceae bacterium]